MSREPDAEPKAFAPLLLIEQKRIAASHNRFGINEVVFVALDERFDVLGTISFTLCLNVTICRASQ